MSTIGYQLNILRDTQMVQRRLLEKQFPYIDWGRMPFSSYGDFFRLRGIIDDCGAVWTNAYGRSNTEADGQRNFLEDYCFHKEDGYPFIWTGYSKNDTSSNVNFSYDSEARTMTITGIENGTSDKVGFYITSNYYPTVATYEVSGLKAGESFFIRGRSTGVVIDKDFAEAHGNGVFTLESPKNTALMWGVKGITDKADRTITIRQLPGYRIADRDISLYNFGYSGMSGYNGYVQDFRDWVSTDESATIVKTEESLKISGNTGGWVVALWEVSTGNRYGKKEWVVNLHIEKSSSDFVSLLFYSQSENQIYKTISLHEGKNIIPALTEEEYSDTSYIRLNVKADSIVTLTQVPEYRGAIVGDGIDDYGQCVKDFALPDDYTVVAMREILGRVSGGCIVSKSRASSNGAFRFEQVVTTGDDIYAACYGNSQLVSNGDIPKLFSYQTRTSYNGRMTLAPGTGTDTTEDKLCVFIRRPSEIKSIPAALYSFGVFSRTLTAEELRIVENCMYAEWICMTGKLEDIEYYDILDARFRSNEEDADKRNRWVGRLGKLRMTLNNYGYSQMSGWNGYPVNWLNWKSAVADNGGIMERRPNAIRVLNVGNVPSRALLSNETDTAELTSMKVRVSGLSDGKSLRFMSIKGDAQDVITTASSDGTYEISVDDADADYHAFVLQGYVANEAADLTIELLPDYGGALVSDGVDDYAVSDEVVDEEIGGVVCHVGYLDNTLANTYGLAVVGSVQNNRLYLQRAQSGTVYIGHPQRAYAGAFPLLPALDRTPVAPAAKLYVGGSEYTRSKCALYQLRLIKTQPTDVQLEAIKWQCRKEHDDYLIHMGWKEVE